MADNTSNKSWFVLITKPRCERKVELQLNRFGIQSFCPTRSEIRQWSDRKKRLRVPLLPSMVLVLLSHNQRTEVFNIPNVKRFLFQDGKPAIVKNKEVENLKLVANSDFSHHELSKTITGHRLNLDQFGFKYQSGVVKYANSKQCWLVLDSIGYVLKLQLSSNTITV